MERRPPGWKGDAKVRLAYEEGGRGIGKALLWDPTREPAIWALIDGTDIWPRWYLSAFRSFYIAENRLEYRRWVDGRHRQRQKVSNRTQKKDLTKKAAEALILKQEDPKIHTDGKEAEPQGTDQS
jgi:hypothetical protein